MVPGVVVRTPYRHDVIIMLHHLSVDGGVVASIGIDKGGDGARELLLEGSFGAEDLTCEIDVWIGHVGMGGRMGRDCGQGRGGELAELVPGAMARGVDEACGDCEEGFQAMFLEVGIDLMVEVCGGVVEGEADGAGEDGIAGMEGAVAGGDPLEVAHELWGRFMVEEC